MPLTPVLFLRAIRVKQWTKNALVFAACIFALGDQGQQVGLREFIISFEAALLFCLVSSGIYLLNDVLDYERDRAHPVKRNRPIAAGQMSRSTGLGLSAAFIVVALATAYLIAPALLGVLLAYVVLQVVYSVRLKRVALVDLFVIAFGFVFRALAGAVAIDVAISPWLVLCTLLLALFLALCKRRHEKVIIDAEGISDTRESLRSYDARLLDQLIGIMASATIVIYSIYTLWPDTVDKFGTHGLAYTIPFVIFGLFRYLDLVYRHEQGGRPEQILLTDIPLIINIGLYGLTALWVLLGL